MERCPVCRSRLRGLTVCRRCGSDLAPLLSISAKAEEALRNALRYTERDELDQARRAAQQARSLRLTPLTKVLPEFLESLEKQELRSCLEKIRRGLGL